MPDTNDRLKKIAEFTQARLEKMAQLNPSEEHNPDYRWQHTLRVTQFGKQLAVEEGANLEVVLAACLLHDIAHFDPGDWTAHGRLGAMFARPLLEELGYPESEIDNICYAVAVHADGVAGYEHEHTLEARVVSDADNIDRFGAYRILLWCAPYIHNFEALVEALTKRVERLEGYRQKQVMETAAGNRHFNQQLDYQLKFFRAILAEQVNTALPKI